MKKILNEFNIFKMIKEDVKKFPITMIITFMLTLSGFGWYIAPLANTDTEMFDIIYGILSRLLIILPICWLISIIIEHKKRFKDKFSIKTGLPYTIFVITKFLVIIVACAFSGDDPHSELAKQMSIFFGIEILWLGIYNIPKIMYKIGIQERKEEKNNNIVTIKCFLASGIGYIYGPLISIAGASIIGNIFM